MPTPLSFLPRLWTNWITLLGTILTTLAGVATILFLVLELIEPDKNPYAATLVVIILPAFFVAGLLVIPLGFWWERRRKKVEPDPIESAFRSALADQKSRKRLLFFGLATLLNVILIAAVGQQAVHYLDSPKFCGTTCHTVMQPEWNAYNKSPHSRVACVQCHIGPGASWAVKAKINGLHQVWGVLTGDYHRPIPSPVEHLRPSRDTCEQCHWPEKFTGNRLKVFPHFKQDKDNTPAYNAVLLRIGGLDPSLGKYLGIHWHVSQNHRVKFQYLDEKRQKIGRIQVYEGDKLTSEYLPAEKDRKTEARGERVMDCVDCHNRPTHIFDRSPALAIDAAIAAGEIDKSVPWIGKVAAESLALKNVDRDNAETFFKKAMEDNYAKNYAADKPAGDVLDKVAKVLAREYRHNIYPEMKIDWGLYRSNIGHQSDTDEAAGCFRCHDSDHEKKLPDGSTQSLGQDCETCHEALATEEDPAKFDDSLKAMLKVDVK